MKHNNKISLNASNQRMLVIAPFIIGIVIILVAVLLQITISKNKLDADIKQYENYIYEDMASEVTNALSMITLYYEQNVNVLTQEEITDGIRTILTTLHPHNMDYYFATDYTGLVIIGPGQGKNQFDVQDKFGTKIVQELINIAQNGGGYFEYYLPDLDGMVQAPKVSYILPFEPYGWYVGVGMLMSEIETMRESFYRAAFLNSLTLIAILGSIVVLIMYFMSRINRRIYKEITSEINEIDHFITQSHNTFVPLDTSKFQYEELEHIGSHACQLIKTQYESQAILEEINCSLEEEIGAHAKAIEQLRDSEARFSSIVNTLPDIIFILDYQGNIIDIAADKKWVVDNNTSYIGQNVVDVIPLDYAKESIEKIQLTLDMDEVQFQEIQFNISEDIYSYEARFVRYSEDKVFVILRSTTELNKALYNFEFLSYHDQLTSLYNRRYMDEAILKINLLEDLPVSVAVIDLNGLKLINDAFGHSVGDEVLKFVAEKLKAICVNHGFVARIGGDEFVLLCPRTSYDAMKTTIENLYLLVHQEFKYGIMVSISVGYETMTQANQSMTSILKAAEKHMYENKIVESQSMRNQAVQAIMKSLNEKNEREKLHSERVSEICSLIGSAMSLDHISNQRLKAAGLLHDIGKISISDAILNKEGSLSDEEYKEIKCHPESSYQILKSIDAYAGLAEDVLSHHERMDGMGYPRGIKGDDISIIARIICVADAFEAMTATRTYRQAISKEEALKELKRHSGSQFDPKIVAIFENQVIDHL